MKFLKPDQYQAKCNKKYSQYLERIQAEEPKAKIEHIGASSISGAYSKGDLDIYVEVDAIDFERSIKQITNIGFEEKQDTLRTPELCMLESINQDDVAVQLVTSGSKFRFFIDFRDVLNREPELVNKYNAMKLSNEGKDQTSYRSDKSRFIDQV